MCRGIEVRLESEECRGQRESLASPVPTVAKGSPGCPGPRVFRGKMGLRVTPAHKVFLVCQALMARKVSVVRRVLEVIQELSD